MGIGILAWNVWDDAKYLTIDNISIRKIAQSSSQFTSKHQQRQDNMSLGLTHGHYCIFTDKFPAEELLKVRDVCPIDFTGITIRQ